MKLLDVQDSEKHFFLIASVLSPFKHILELVFKTVNMMNSMSCFLTFQFTIFQKDG
jgi:hypothetical protein